MKKFVRVIWRPIEIGSSVKVRLPPDSSQITDILEDPRSATTRQLQPGILILFEPPAPPGISMRR
jgi:hypothetical protein